MISWSTYEFVSITGHGPIGINSLILIRNGILKLFIFLYPTHGVSLAKFLIMEMN